jgi:Spy/CpxP family protein refolding chaperone
MDEQKATAPESRPRWGRRIAYASLAAGVLVTVVALAAARPIAAAIQQGGGFGGFHHRWAGHWGPQGMSPEAAKEHLQVAAKWALRDIDASDQQQEKVNAIVAAAVDDLFKLRDQHHANQAALHAELMGATIDRAALEQTRQSEMALADQASKRLVQALADLSEVLTPEQRQALAERIHHRHQTWGSSGR